MNGATFLPERYQVIELVGTGLASEVYKVRDTTLNKIVALKLSKPEQSQESALRFQREFYFLSRFDHPHIVPVHDFGTTKDGRPFFTMDYISGTPITRYFSGFDPAIFPIIAQICQALEAIHNQGLVHCDLKPENIIIRKNKPQAVILDFGFAEQTLEPEVQSAGGTLGYIAPEVFKGTGIDARTDLYSLGMVLYETLARRRPFGEKSPVSQLKAQYRSELPRLRSFNPKVPEELDTLIRRMAEREPEARPNSAYQVLESLSTISSMSVRLPTASSTKNLLLTSGFIGRDELLEELKGRTVRLVLGQTATPTEPTVVLITGEQGVGKTRLLKEFKFLLQLERTPVIAYDPVALGERTRQLLPHLVFQILGRHETSAVSPAEDKKYELFERLVVELQKQAPLVFLLDDLHLVDPPGLDFFRYLALSAARGRILMVATSLSEIPGSQSRDGGTAGRTEHHPSDRFSFLSSLVLKPYIDHRSLPPLTEEETGRLTRSLLGAIEKPEQLTPWLYQRTGGNPLFIYETIHGLVEQSILKRKTGRWVVGTEIFSRYKPAPRLSEHIAVRLSSLSSDERHVLNFASAIGRSFDLRLLPKKTGSQFATLETLVVKGFMNSTIANGRTEYAVSNKTIEELVDRQLKGEERKKTFRQVAETLEALGAEDEFLFELATSFAEAKIKDKAYRYGLKAARQAQAAYLLPEALHYYKRVRGLVSVQTPPEEQLAILEAVGDLENLTASFAAAETAYDETVKLLKTDKRFSGLGSRLPRLLWKKGKVYQLQGKTDVAIATFQSARELLPTEPTAQGAYLASSLGWAYNALGDYGRAEQTFHQTLEIADQLNHPETAAEGYYGLSATAWYKKNYQQALGFAHESKKIAERSNQTYHLAVVNSFLGTLYGAHGELEPARAAYEQALQFLEKTVSPYYCIRALHGLGLIYTELSQWEKARRSLEDALQWAEKLGDAGEIANLKSNLGQVLVEVGEWQAAMAAYQANRLIREQAGDTKLLSATLDNIGELLMLEGNLSQAEEHFQAALHNAENPFFIYCDLTRLHQLKHDYQSARHAAAQALRLVRQANNRHWSGKIFLVVGELHFQLNNFQRAVRYAQNALSALPDQSKEHAMGLRLAGSAQVASGDTTGSQAVRDATARLRRLGARYELARSLFGYVRLMVGSGFDAVSMETAAAFVRDLEEAQTIFKQVGAKLDYEQTQKLKDELVRNLLATKPERWARREYLPIFSRLSELISLGLAQENFLERILDLVIEITGAERGLLFLLENDELRLVAGRNIDHLTTEDAKHISHSIIRKAEQAQEPVFCADALADPRFDSSQSVILNRIRSILCAPLVTPGGVIGTIYLDSRITNNLFLAEEKDFLQAVANLLAATIDKSVTFKKLEDQVSSLREGIIVDAATGYFLGKSAAVRQIYGEVEKIAPTDCTVLILGATGSGKGILARLVHNRSPRRDNKFVSVNCGTLPETLFESELFGHRKGAFTGALRDRQGMLEAAAGGTVFLDEITNTSPAIQAKLLELLDDKTIRRLGDDESRTVDVRLVCATNRDLQEEITAGRFREDLFYRLSVVTIRVPPLRERLEDIPLLAQYFIEQYARQLNKNITGFTSEVRALFLKYPWPGNVRELQNTIERAVIMTEEKKIGLTDLKLHFMPEESQPVALRTDRKTFERKRIVDALRKAQGNVSQAAKLLSIHRRQLQRYIKTYQIKREEFS